MKAYSVSKEQQDEVLQSLADYQEFIRSVAKNCGHNQIEELHNYTLENVLLNKVR